MPQQLVLMTDGYCVTRKPEGANFWFVRHPKDTGLPLFVLRFFDPMTSRSRVFLIGNNFKEVNRKDVQGRIDNASSHFEIHSLDHANMGRFIENDLKFSFSKKLISRFRFRRFFASSQFFFDEKRLLLTTLILVCFVPYCVLNIGKVFFSLFAALVLSFRSYTYFSESGNVPDGFLKLVRLLEVAGIGRLDDTRFKKSAFSFSFLLSKIRSLAAVFVSSRYLLNIDVFFKEPYPKKLAQSQSPLYLLVSEYNMVGLIYFSLIGWIAQCITGCSQVWYAIPVIQFYVMFLVNREMQKKHSSGEVILSNASLRLSLQGTLKLIERASQYEKNHLRSYKPEESGNDYLPSLFKPDCFLGRESAMLTVGYPSGVMEFHTILFVEGRGRSNASLNITRFDFGHGEEGFSGAIPRLLVTNAIVNASLDLMDTDGNYKLLDRSCLQDDIDEKKWIQRNIIVSLQAAKRVLSNIKHARANAAYNIRKKNCFIAVMEQLKAVDALPVDLQMELEGRLPAGFWPEMKHQNDFISAQLEAYALKYTH